MNGQPPPDPIAALHIDPSRLSAAEVRLAHEVSVDPAIVVDLSITDLAARCETSPATVARFAQRLGFSGYRQFRMELAQALSRERAERERFGLDDEDLLVEDSAHSVAAKIAYQEMRAINQTALGLDPDGIDAVAALIGGARRVDIFAVGASALAALDLQLKLTRVGIEAWHSNDLHLCLLQAAQRDGRDVAIGISHSGSTAEVIEPLGIARTAGAATIALTNTSGSRITGDADHVLLTAARESPLRIAAMSSRIAQLTVIDIVFTRIVQARGDDARTALRFTREVIERHERHGGAS